MTDKKKIEKTAEIAGGSLLGVSALAYGILVRLFCNLAFERKAILKIGGGEEEEKDPLVTAGQDWLHENDKQIVSRSSSDGMKLFAHYFPAENAKATIIEFHGWHGSWDYDFSASSPYWNRMGYNLLIVEQRGQGRSDGKYMSFGILERLDVPEWVEWYRSNYEKDLPILIAGISLGGATVLMASDMEYPPQVRGILADCGFSSAYDIINHVGGRFFHMPEHPMCDGINLYCRLKFGFDLRDHAAIDAVKTAKLPILFVHGKKDNFVPWKMSIDMYEACTGRKELWLVDNAGHGKSFLEQPQEYIRKVEEFFGL